MKHIVRTGVLSLSFSCLLHASSVYVEDFWQESQKTEFSVGVAGGYVDSGYRGKSIDWTVASLVQFETKRLYIRGLLAGVRLCTSTDQSQEALLGAIYLYDHGLKSSDSDNARLKRLDHHKNAVMAGIPYNLYSPCGNPEAQVSYDTLDTNKGIRAQVQYSCFWQPTSKLFVKPAVGAPYSDKKFNCYYYGINVDEARRSGLNAYQPKSFAHPCTGLETQYSFTPKSSAFVGVLVEALPSTVKNSPMNDGKYRVEGTAGLMYRF